MIIRKKLSRLIILCTLLILTNGNQTASLVNLPSPNLEREQTIYDNFRRNSIISNEIKANASSILNDPQFISSIFDFLERVKDKGDIELPSMDHAYFIGMALELLSKIENTPNVLVDDISLLKGKILNFINSSRNSNGGYGNWDGARSSMESTFQAISVYSTFNLLETFKIEDLNQTLEFINSLKVTSGGYYPLENWDVGDISSSYRALWIKDQFRNLYPTLNYGNDTDLANFVGNNFIPPFFINGASGYSEVKNGNAELLASFYATKIFELLDIQDPHAEQVAKFVASLVSPNGGIAGIVGNLPTTGFTGVGIKLYLALQNNTLLQLDQIFSTTFIQDTTGYIKLNHETLSGYTSSDRDSTASIISTFFVLDLLNELVKYNQDINSFAFDGVYEFLLFGQQPSFSYGNFPGDGSDLSYTTMAITIAEILNSTSITNPSIVKFLSESFNSNLGGFGFQPFASPRIKYTFYGIRALRAISSDISDVAGLRSFIMNSITLDGGFGQFPGAKLSYLSHTYWALFALAALGELDFTQIDADNLKNWVDNLESINGTYSNSLTSDPSIISTYRALAIKQLLNKSIELSLFTKNHIFEFQKADGGFGNKLDTSYSTMEATYYAVQLGLQYNLNFNYTKILDYISSIQNSDGGFGLRVGFTSRLSSTYFAILTLASIFFATKQQNSIFLETKNFDIYAPIIIPAFISSIDTNKTIQGTFRTSAEIRDPESAINKSIAIVTYRSNNLVENFVIQGTIDPEKPKTWSFLIGPFTTDGHVRFQIQAWDMNNNTVKTELFDINIIGVDSQETPSTKKFNAGDLIPVLPYVIFILVLADAIISFYYKKHLLKVNL